MIRRMVVVGIVAMGRDGRGLRSRRQPAKPKAALSHAMFADRGTDARTTVKMTTTRSSTGAETLIGGWPRNLSAKQARRWCVRVSAADLGTRRRPA